MGIREWYQGKNVLVSGGTGFMGKVLIEKLLRSCPDIGTIYVLCRSKRGISAVQRVADFSKLPLFAPLLNENPQALKKLIAIDSTLSDKDIGVNLETKQLLQNNVNIVFHLAASLRFEAGLKEAVKFNLEGTLQMLEFATGIKNLAIFVHFSTAFSHCEEKILEEKIYSPIYNPHDIITAMNWMNDSIVESITKRILGEHPNCYTFTKRLAESLVGEYADRVPLTIVRPSIVTPVMSEPVPGWVDNLNGPIGVLAAGGKGVLRSLMCNPDNNAELIPVDIATNAILIDTWNSATHKKKEEIPVYNISAGDVVKITWGELLTLGKKVIMEVPFDAGLWYPGGTIRTNRLIHTIIVLLFQTIPAYFIDFIMLLTRNKRFLVRVQNRIKCGMALLEYFTLRKWTFRANKSKEIFINDLSPEEQQIFYMPLNGVNFQKLITDAIIGARVYCLKEPLETLPRARRHLQWLYILDKVTQISLLVLFGWLLAGYFPVILRFVDTVLAGTMKVQL